MTVLHVTVHAHPARKFGCAEVTVRGIEVPAIDASSDAFQLPLPVSFDQVLDNLQRLPRLFIEPDGSFIWIGPGGPDEWQFDGQLHDSTGGLMTVELKVSGADPDWDTLLSCLGWPQTTLVFELVREGIYLDERSLRRLTDR
jgi:hypothetical protein